MFKCDQCELKYKIKQKNFQNYMDTKHLNKYEMGLKSNNNLSSKDFFLKPMNKKHIESESESFRVMTF